MTPVKYLTIKKITPKRGGKSQLIFKGGEKPYDILTKDVSQFSVGMQVCMKRGKIFPV